MANYDAAPIQPFINGIITADEEGGAVHWNGRGVSTIVRTPAGAPLFGAALGDFLLTLDFGLPGSVGIDPNFAKAMITERGTLGAHAGGTTITEQAVTYPTTATVRVVISIAGAGTDPSISVGGGVELVVWRTN